MHKINYEGDSKVIKRLCEMVNELIDHGAGTVEDLTDVELTDLTDGQILKYDSLNEQWINADDAGGTEVIANPTGTPTEDLTSIQIGEDIYRIVGGGGGGGGSQEVELIYENTSRTIQDTITLDNPYTDYDYLVLEISDIAQYSYKLQTMIVLKEQMDDALNTGNYISFYQAANAYLQYTVTDTTTLTKDNAAYECITKIYGVKAGRGTEVIANPEGTATDELTKIQIGDEIYEIVGGGSGGSGYDATVLWDYKTDNNNSVLYGLNSATLHDSAENYDALIIEVVSIISDETDATWKGTCQFFVDVNAVDNAFNEKYILCESVANRSCKYHIDGTTLQKTAEAAANTNGLVRVYGLKYGSGGQGGEGYKTENLYDNPTGNIVSGEITLAHSILDYDDIEFVAGVATNSDRGRTAVRINAQYFYDTFKYTTAHSADHYGISFWADMAVDVSLGQGDDPTKLNFFNQYGSVNTALYQINGIKYGTGGVSGGGGSEIIPISEGDGTTSRTFTLSKTPKFVSISWTEGDTSAAWNTSYWFNWGDRRTYGMGGDTDSATYGQNAKVAAITYGADGKSFTITAANAGSACNSSGTDHHGFLYVDYGGGGTGGSGYTETSLYTASSRSITIALSDNIANYDAIEIEVSWTYNGTPYHISQIISSDVLGVSQKPYTIGTSVYRYHTFTVATTTTTTFTLIDADADTYISKVVGIKYGGSGSGGASALEDLTDVDLTSLSNGQILKWDATAQKWLNANESGGGGVDTDMIAEDFDSSTSYTGKCFVIHDGSLYYRDFGSMTWQGDWNPSIWTEINVTDGMLNFDSQLETSIETVSQADAKTRSFVASNFGSMVSYGNGDYVINNNKLYKNIREDGGAGTGWDATKWQEISNLASEVKKVDKKIIYQYSTHEIYSVGDYTNHSGDIYRCTTAISTPEAFDSNKWQLVPSVMDEISKYSTLDGLNDVDITTPTNNDYLKYDSTNQEWVNCVPLQPITQTNYDNLSSAEKNRTDKAYFITDGDADGLQLGETNLTAYRGDRGKTAYDTALANRENIAPEYDATSTYRVGDIVFYNNLMYRCISAITTAEAWDSTHWERTTLAEILTNFRIDYNPTKRARVVTTSDGNTIMLAGFSDLTEDNGVRIEGDNHGIIIRKKTNGGSWVKIFDTTSVGSSSTTALIKVQTITSSSHTYAANATYTNTIDATVSGYTPIGIVGWTLSTANLEVIEIYMSGTNGKANLRNRASSQVSNATISLRVLYVKTS